MGGAQGCFLDLGRVTARVRASLAPADTGSLDRISECVHALTGGWEALVEAVLSEGPDPWTLPEVPLDRLARPGGPVEEAVRDSLAGDLDRSSTRLLGLLAGLAPLPRSLVEDLDPGLIDAYDDLVERRLLGPDPEGTARLVPLVAAVLSARGSCRSAWLGVCSAWYSTAGHYGAALRAARLAEDRAACLALVEQHGDRITRTGWCRDVLIALPSPPEGGSARTLAHWAQAALVAGKPLLADRALAALVATAERAGRPVPADLAWRWGQVKYGRGEYHAAVRLCAYPPRAGESPPDRAMRLAGLAVASRALGDRTTALTAAEQAVETVRETPGIDDSAAAMAMLSHGLLSSAARRLNLLSESLTHAELADDVVLTQRALVNLSDAHLIGAEYAVALRRADQALALVHRTGPVGCYSVALHNRGEALLGLGRMPEARTSFLRCLDLARRHGVARTAGPLHGLAEVDYQCGRLADAAAGFGEAHDLAQDGADLEILGPTLARLATIRATGATTAERSLAGAPDRDPADELEQARRLADLAIDCAEPDYLPAALIARGWVAVAAQEPDALSRATAALEVLRSRQLRRTLGEALELQAAASLDPREAMHALEQAIAVYDAAGSTHLADRVRVEAARLPQADRLHRAAGRAAQRRLRRAGRSAGRVHPGGVLTEGHAVVRVLGPFQVQVDGRSVSGTAWRSRQARTLMKILLARQGRLLTREELCDLLWPDDEPARTGHRLSVLLSTLRTALDPDRRWPTDRFLIADATGVRASTEHITVDLHDFLTDAEDVCARTDLDDPGLRALLGDLLREHNGEAFEDEPFEAWAQQARDHVRNVQVQCLRTAAGLAGRAGEVDEAITLLVRLLSVDPYDEPAHRLLVSALARAGRHGEVQRAHDRWTRANTELGVPPPPPLPLSRTAP
ncbi:BTAD domain-containing putative transcriptional regulator [Nocardioides insulae]|uniref:BTAD domain-containing putative transcriptional regulator n=1 Tax=Nocardioides insulae TaxID=394734 RepID=UPI00040555EE|nr:BTAD domain-containing putative transcriptional regulator [Nocardioides insulae]